MKSKLYGDGIHDDTAAIQEMIDSGSTLVALPVPEKHYLISKTLVLPSNIELRLDRLTTIKLAPKSNCPMLTNSDYEKGNCRIIIDGGIWDLNNLEQAPNPMMLQGDTNPDQVKRLPIPADYPIDPELGYAAPAGDRMWHPDRYWGSGLFFLNVDQFEMRNMVLKDPVTFAAQFARLSNFTMCHITFDFNEGNPAPNNMDGLHFDGFCRNGKISDLKGACYDDLLAFNADDGTIDSPCFGPIENIEVDGIFADRCHSAARLLSCGSMIRNITIRNVHGTFYRYCVGFTHFFPERKARGRFDHIVLENFFIGKDLPLESDWNKCPDFPLIWGEGNGSIGSLRITGLHRVEEHTPVPAVEFGADFEVGQLTMSDCSCENHLPDELVFLQNNGKIEKLSFDGCRCVSAPGAGKIIVANGNKALE